MVNVEKRLAATLLCMALAGTVFAADFMCGFSRPRVVRELGHPLREIQTGKGVLLFYGSVFLELEEHAVVFINVLSENELERRRQEDARRGVYWGETEPPRTLMDGPVPTVHRTMSAREQEDWLARKQRHREQTIETRVRRFLLNRTFLNLMRLHPIHAWPSTSWRQRLTARSTLTSRLHIKDSQGRRIPAIGEDRQYIERHVDFGEALIDRPLMAQSASR